MEDAKLMQEWVDALRSGDYKQNYYTLTKANDEGNPTCFCVIGVLADILYKQGYATRRKLHTEIDTRFIYVFGLYESSTQIPPKYVDGMHQMLLINMNDSKKYSFDELADYIEENIIGPLIVKND